MFSGQGRRQSQAKTSHLWKVDRHSYSLRSGRPSYFFGTIHVPYSQVSDSIPDIVFEAFQEADHIYTEVDLDSTSPEVLDETRKCMLLPGHQKLSDVLPEDLYSRLKSYLPGPTSEWERLHPFFLINMVEAIQRKPSNLQETEDSDLDQIISNTAVSNGKDVSGIQQPQESLSFLQEVDMSVFIQELNDTLQRAEKVLKDLAPPDEVEEMDERIKKYRSGELGAETMLSGNEFVAKLQQVLLKKRNQVMAARAIQLIKDNPKTSFFFAFGVGHFRASSQWSSILDIVREAGFQVRHVSSG